jgi:hypothetical protein
LRSFFLNVTINQYVFCANNPVNFRDPWGLYEYDTANMGVAFLHEINPFNADGCFWRGTAAYVDGFVPVINPMEMMGAYDGTDSAFVASRTVGEVTAFAESLLMPAAAGAALAREAGVMADTTVLSRYAVGMFRGIATIESSAGRIAAGYGIIGYTAAQGYGAYRDVQDLVGRDQDAYADDCK